ncbi:N-acyl homoserine lactonase family protein [Ruegeria marina]|uniref:Glyoxylase, beta-lactamase superfamily II n=1 Tax=Ruegeria marina TaxID=639004 RepID=A0A1G6TFM9_9RHOB|nr:N-acyl homoserine lactonase family protein [Ruegeria marina]SDD27664.1 Glyoxylase, beta-lactamase superfamily II [Ruegeria marina]
MGSADTGIWEAYAIEYGRHADRQVHENFTAPLPSAFPRADAAMPLSFFIWLLRSGDRVIAVDTGFAEAEARARGREVLLSLETALAALGIARDKVQDVILTHLHWDHAGNHDLFPQARLHVQAVEMAYCTGPCMCHAALRKPYDPASVAALVKRVHAGHVQFHEGRAEIAPGVFVHLVGGHTRGLQVVTAETRRGRLVLASDAVHYYANAELEHPFPLIHDAEAMLEGFRTVKRLAPSPAHIVAGHDPLVLERFAPVDAAGLPGIVRLDIEPARS